ncbi:hypothetical protein [Ruegeria faecimaris]|uniref:hypothetical protein n=1 Tax=Ruegeria faecimaris TaxID=686389 RepID=UPI00248FCEA4|nr:hypothetical protein [Ruegeria faecimaris]
MRIWGSLLVAGVLVLSIGVAGSAKPLSRIIAESGLSPDDFTLLSATTDTMLGSGLPQVGAESEWISTKTGAKGTVRVREVRDNCVHLQHFIRPPSSEQTREIRTRRCQDANGNWIFTP